MCEFRRVGIRDSTLIDLQNYDNHVVPNKGMTEKCFDYEERSNKHDYENDGKWLTTFQLQSVV